jgi:dipeptidyl aminopeptidase/acylaminoacyl peptidase
MGDLLKGVLLYPANYEKGKRYPVVCEVYSTFSGQLHRFFLHLYNLQVLTNRGYAVFLPDLKFYEGDLPRSYIQCIEPALDRLVDIGIADGNFGIMGHSFGGYGTNVLATHSKRFKVAVALSGMSNLISYHGTLPSDYGRGYTRGTNELGGGRLGEDPKTIVDRYIKNSPVFFLHQVQTPLMLIHGTEDWTVPFSQAEEMYYGLRHLGKPAVLVGYPGEGHLWYGTKIEVFRDMWQRILSWFDKYLKAKSHS